MEEVTVTLMLYRVFQALVSIGAMASMFLGFLFLFTPDSVYRLDKRINYPVVTLDTILGKQPRLTGSVLLLLGAILCTLLFLYY
ncbi:MAG: hypothetical protein U9R33_04010 [candidate division NC10 bacterium]|nr:hypothetical protein [candidate division NC10 bacterium]